MREHWENLLKYLVFNNPDAVQEILSEDFGVSTVPMTTDELLSAATEAANNTGDPESFTMELASLTPHNSEATNWANLLNYAHV